MDNPKISFQYGTFLKVDDSMLQTDYFQPDPEKRRVSVDELEEILHLGGTAIRSHIEAVYEKTVARNPRASTTATPDAIVRPSIWVAQMTGPHHTTRAAYSKRGYENFTRVITDPLEIRPALRPYWHAVERAGFITESRQYPSEAHRDAGAWLLARTEPTKLPEKYELDS